MTIADEPTVEERLRRVTKARDRLADLAELLAAGDFPPSAVECRALIAELRRPQ